MRAALFGITVLVVVASLLMAGCTSFTSSDQTANNTSTTQSDSVHVTTSAPVTATPSVTPSPSVAQTAAPVSRGTPTPSTYPTPTPVPTASWRSTAAPTPHGSGSASLTVLFFYKPECPYCQAMEPKVTLLQDTYAGKVSVQWVVSEQSPLTTQYGVAIVPTLILLNNGYEAGRWVGASDTNGVSAQINSILGAR